MHSPVAKRFHTPVSTNANAQGLHAAVGDESDGTGSEWPSASSSSRFASRLFRLLRDIDLDKVVAALRQPRCITSSSPAASSPRLRHADVLRFLLAAHDRPARRAVSGRRLRQLHQLRDRPQSRRDGLHRRCRPLPHLLGLGPRRPRRRQDRVRHRADVLARQCVRARARHGLCAGGGERRSISSALDQPGDRPLRGSRSSSPICSGCCRGRARSAATNGRSTLPSARLTLVQIGIGILDLTAGALAMYTLLPGAPSSIS